MDIEEDIRALQLDSSEGNGVMANVEDVKPQDVEKPDLKDEVNATSKPVTIEPECTSEVKHKDTEDKMEDIRKRHLNVVFIGHVGRLIRFGVVMRGSQLLEGRYSSLVVRLMTVQSKNMRKKQRIKVEKAGETLCCFSIKVGWKIYSYYGRTSVAITVLMLVFVASYRSFYMEVMEWYMAYIMDTNEEERVKGITVEVGRAQFETETTRFTILDAPGHKSYVPNMITGASQADIGVLVISARKGEFETGYERGGQTREHVQLAKTLGVSKLFVVVNKMDDPTVNWSKERYDEIESKMTPFLRASGYNVKKDVQFLPLSGLVGSNMKTRVDKSICPWWNGSCLLEALDAVEVPQRDPKGLLRLPIIDKFKDLGTVVMGKVESGSVREGDNLLVMPNRAQVKVLAIYCDEDKVKHAGPGENLRVRLSGIEEEDILSGFVLCSVANPIPAVSEFVAQLQILESLDNAIFTAGYKAVLHIHAIVEECEIVELMQQIDPKTKKPMKKKILFVKNGAVVICRMQVNNMICIEKFTAFPQLGRFTLRTEGDELTLGKQLRWEKLLMFFPKSNIFDVRGLVESIGYDGGVNAGVEEGEALLEECAGNDDDGGGSVAGDDVLGLGELDEHLGGGLEDLHLVEDGGAVVGDDDLAGGGGDHLVHALGAQAGPDGVGHDIGAADAFLALVVHVGLCF
ncbi:hypothetical protein RHGRI_034641 [Rhododendron griersonianum]|uniref:Tr-type G domain-containing protein n=1 Tax=Rhododendron griersonianum TaxID=479676 RepID=A0AAV6I722_9ERIC|nr:hypothetical protein RHGRI_034641 [Rhododendron griersonianum]